MDILYPRIPLRRWLAMLRIAFVGAAIAGLYGIIHDQVTFSISPEYFTRLKFPQFHWANTGLPVRLFVAEIGFLATWWVGFIAGWVLARISTQAAEPRPVFNLVTRGFAIVVGFAFVAAVAAFMYGLRRDIQSENSGLAAFAVDLGVSDVPAFVRVAYIHNAGYLGGLLGLIAAALLLARKARRA